VSAPSSTAPAKSSGLAFWGVIAFLSLAVIAGGAVGMWNYRRGPVVETLRAAELAPLPTASHRVTSTQRVQGQHYAVVVHFHASPADVDRWVKTSPSLLQRTPTVVADHVRQFDLPASRNAKSVRITVDDAQGAVEIDLQRD